MYSKSQDQVINDFQQIFGSKYDYSQVEYRGCRHKVNIICPDHGLFSMTPTHHKGGKGCYHCGRVSAGAKNKRTLTCTNDKFIQKAQLKHGLIYDYKHTNYVHSYSDVTIICHIHGPFELMASRHLEGQGCPKCSNAQRINRLTMFQSKEEVEQFIDNKFKGSIQLVNVPDRLRHGSEVTVECHVHGLFQTKISHLKHTKFGCKECGYTSASTQRSKSTAQFIQECLAIHGDTYDYSKTTWTHANAKSLFICKKHGEFEQYVGAHLGGSGCPKCKKRISTPCMAWIASFNNPNIIKEYKIAKKFVDGFDPSTNTIYEFYGDYWHGNPQKFPSDQYNPSCKVTMGELYNRTVKRAEFLKSLGYSLVEIWESDWMSR